MSKEIDDIFSNKMDDEIKKEIKKKRNKLNSKLIGKAILATLVILVVSNLVLGFASKKYIEYRFNNKTSEKSVEYMVSNPNEYIGKQSYIETGLFKYSSTYDIAKKVGSRTIYAGSDNEAGSLIKFGLVGLQSFFIDEDNPILDNNIENRRSNAFGLRKLCFMMPYVDYENVINDFNYLNEIDNNKYVEMVLSFDKEYTYDEVNTMLDSNLINFYWIDNNYEETKEYYTESKYYYDEDLVVGVKSHNYAGAFITDVDERLDIFKGAIGFLRESASSGMVDNIDENNIEISGVVVQGNPEDLKKFENNNMIKHGILGNVIDEI